MRSNGFRLLFCTMWFLFVVTSVSAREQVITQNLVISGSEKPIILTPYQSHKQSSSDYSLYEIDYDELKRQISIYKTIYLTGQLMHGALMVKMKPKFVD